MEWANISTWCEGSRRLRLGIDGWWFPVHRGSISPRALESQRLCKLTRSTVRWLWPNRWVLLRCQVPEPITISQCYPTVIGPLYCDRTSHWLCDCLFQSVRDLNSLSKPSWHFSLSTSPILLLPLRLYFLFLFLRLLLLVALFFGCLSQLSDLGFIDSSPASSISSYPSFLISYPYSPPLQLSCHAIPSILLRIHLPELHSATMPSLFLWFFYRTRNTSVILGPLFPVLLGFNTYFPRPLVLLFLLISKY